MYLFRGILIQRPQSITFHPSQPASRGVCWSVKVRAARSRNERISGRWVGGCGTALSALCYVDFEYHITAEAMRGDASDPQMSASGRRWWNWYPAWVVPAGWQLLQSHFSSPDSSVVSQDALWCHLSCGSFAPIPGTPRCFMMQIHRCPAYAFHFIYAFDCLGQISAGFRKKLEALRSKIEK